MTNRDLYPEMIGEPGLEEWLALPAIPAEPPSLLAMAGSAVKAVVAHVADGLRRATPEAQEQRLATCRACPLFDPEAARCGLCGCYLPVKVAMASEACPEGRWGPA